MLHLAFIYGAFATKGRGPFDIERLSAKDLTGSESFFFGAVRGMGDRGHDLDVYGPWARSYRDGKTNYISANVEWLQDGTGYRTSMDVCNIPYDFVISWNEPDYLSLFPKAGKRVCEQQLNDFSYCRHSYLDFTDLFLFPSAVHREHLIKTTPGLNPDKCKVFSNCINNQDNFAAPNWEPRNHSLAYVSSPDRGLHRLCELFPKIKRQVPDVTLKIFYQYQTWYDLVHGAWTGPWMELGFRARYTQEFFSRFGTKGENGVYLCGPRPSAEVARTLQNTRLLVYPCDTLSFTEGFGVAVLDACYAGCLPVISDVDAFGSVYGGTAEVIPGRPGDNKEKWVDTVVRCLKDDDYVLQRTKVCRSFAEKYTREAKAEELEGLLNA